MRIASVMSSERGQVDKVLAVVAATLIAEGLRVAGVVQTNIDRPGSKHCAMDVMVLPAGPVIRINQELGESALGCRLDPGALETAVAKVEAGFANDTDVLIINKFGKHEGEGRGFRGLIAEALSLGIPVLTGVNATNRAAFAAFAEGLADPLGAEPTAILAWCRANILTPAA